jgi:nitrite reductase/ring-hydroxylating ferredoxin subunit
LKTPIRIYFRISNVIDISEGLPHKVSEVICIKCGERWLAVRPEGTLLKELECPNHHVGFVIETGEDMEDENA